MIASFADRIIKFCQLGRREGELPEEFQFFNTNESVLRWLLSPGQDSMRPLGILVRRNNEKTLLLDASAELTFGKATSNHSIAFCRLLIVSRACPALFGFENDG